MYTPSRRAPRDLPRAVRDLIAEGGNVLATDDAPLIRLLPIGYSFDTDAVPARHVRGIAEE